MLRRTFQLMILAVLSALAGCNYEERPQSERLQVPVLPAQRFQLANTGNGQLALDTQTGQICKTHDWQGFANPSIALCFDLYKQFPSIGELQEVKVMDRGSKGEIVEKGVKQQFVIPLEVTPRRQIDFTKDKTKNANDPLSIR